MKEYKVMRMIAAHMETCIVRAGISGEAKARMTR
jgi:hypothetical protein